MAKEGLDALVLIQTNYTDEKHQFPTDTLLMIGKVKTGVNHWATSTDIVPKAGLEHYIQATRIFHAESGNSSPTDARLEIPPRTSPYPNQDFVTQFTDYVNSKLKEGAITRAEPAKDAASLAAAMKAGFTPGQHTYEGASGAPIDPTILSALKMGLT